MNYDNAEYLAALWEDVHEIENIMGRRAFMNLYIQEKETFRELWTHDNPVLGTNDGYYVGYEAVASYFDAIAQYTHLRAEAAQAAHPDILGGKEIGDILGVGAAHMDNITTPVIEIAFDRQTAKGLWYALDSSVDYYPDGYGSRMRWGRIAADFRKEDGHWKIWHLLLLSDIETKLGADWTQQNKESISNEPIPSLAAFCFPDPTICASLYKKWSKDRTVYDFPQVPVPYETFAETFSYGVEEQR